MPNRPQYRIVEEWGEVHIQRRKHLLCFAWWSYLCWLSSDSYSGHVIDFKTLEAAKEEVIRQLAVHRQIYEVGPIYTYWPQ